MTRLAGIALVGLAAGLALGAGTEDAAGRGRKHLLGDNYIPAIWSRDAYEGWAR